MTPMRALLATVLLAVGLSSCGAQPNDAAAETAATAVFQRYYRALVDRDFTTACSLAAPETKTAMLDNLRKQGGITVASCEEGFQRIYAVPGAAELADRIATTARVGDVTVTGQQAAITWTAEVSSGTQTVTNRMRLVDGEWRLLDTNT